MLAVLDVTQQLAAEERAMPPLPIHKGERVMKKFKCTVCGFIYDPAVGDPDNGINPQTAFEDLPEDWTCPDCGVGKDMFEEMED